MSNSALTVSSDSVEIYEVNRRRLTYLSDHRKLQQQSIYIRYSVTVTSSLQVIVYINIIINISNILITIYYNHQAANSLANTFQSNFGSGAFALSIQNIAISNGATGLQNVNVYGLSVSVNEINSSGSNSSSSNSSSSSSSSSSSTRATSYGFIGVAFAVVLVILLTIYILYHYKTRKVLYISGIAEEINILDIQSVLPGAISVMKYNDDQLIVFDTNINARRSYSMCDSKSNSSIIFRNSKIKLKWKPILSFSKSSGISEVQKKSKNNSIPDGYREFHGFLIPTTSTIERYEHKPQYNIHTLREGEVTVIQQKLDSNIIEQCSAKFSIFGMCV